MPFSVFGLKVQMLYLFEMFKWRQIKLLVQKNLLALASLPFNESTFRPSTY